MLEFIQCGELKAQAKRLLRYRAMLILLIVANMVMVLRVPLTPSNRALAHADSLAHTDSLATPSPTHAVVTDADAASAITPPPHSYKANAAATSLRAATAPALAEAYSEARQWLSSLVQQEPAPVDSPARGVSGGDAGPSTHDAKEQSATGEPLWQSWSQFRLAPWWPHPSMAQPHHPSHSLTPIQTEPLLPYSARGVPRMEMPSDPSQQATAVAVPNDPEPAVVHALPPAVDPADSAEPRPAVAMDLELVNPKSNRGSIRFLLNHRDLELRPGESHRFPMAEQWLIQFHRGGEFENVQRTLLPGKYQFRVTNLGWELTPAD